MKNLIQLSYIRNSTPLATPGSLIMGENQWPIKTWDVFLGGHLMASLHSCPVHTQPPLSRWSHSHLSGCRDGQGQRFLCWGLSCHRACSAQLLRFPYQLQNLSQNCCHRRPVDIEQFLATIRPCAVLYLKARTKVFKPREVSAQDHHVTGCEALARVQSRAGVV